MSINTHHYNAKLDIPYGQLATIIQWCEDNCQSDWKYNVIDYGGKDPGSYEFLFNDEKDYVKFLLWKK